MSEYDRMKADYERLKKLERDRLESEVIADLRSQLAEAQLERDEARDWVRKLTREERVLTCIYCGHAYPPGSPTHGAEVLTAHAMVCTKHPLRIAVAALEWYEVHADIGELNDRARKALAEIRGTTDERKGGT